MHHRLSNKDRPLSPSELVSPLPEAYQKDEEEKEVAPPPPIQSNAKYEEAGETTASKPRRRICGIPLLWLLIIAGVIIALAIGLGVGLGVGLNKNNSSSSDEYETPVNAEYLIGGAINPAFYSEMGLYNGSGIALAQQSFSNDLTSGAQGTIVVYFQHWTGQIRYVQLTNSGAWVGGDSSTIVASDAKNNTPLSAVSYVATGYVSTWHLFYIDQNNTLRQRSNSNASSAYTTPGIWTDGPINNLDLKVWDADQVGMQACWYGNDYGDSDYVHSPIPGTDQVNASANSDVGMHMWYASDNNTFQQYGWRQDANNTWQFQNTFENMNGHAGVGCFSWGPGTVTYVMMVNEENTVEFWWRDTNTNLTNSTTHPINVWVQAPITIEDVYPTTSLGYTNSFYAQSAADLYFYGHNVTWAAENTTIATPFKVASSQPALPGSHLSVTELPGPSGGNDLVVFFQMNGTDLSEYTRDVVAGAWANVPITIPQT